MKTLSHPCRLAVTALATGLLAVSMLVAPDARAQAASTTQQRIDLMVAALQARDDGDLVKAKDYVQRLLVLAPNDPSAQDLLRSINADLARQGVVTPAAATAPGPVVVAAASTPPPPPAPASTAASSEPATPAAAGEAPAAPAEAAPVASAAPEAPAAPPANPELAALQVQIAKQTDTRSIAQDNIKQANKLIAEGSYQQAGELLTATQAEIPDGIAFATVNSQIKTAQGKIIYDQAMNAFNSRNLDAAAELVGQYGQLMGTSSETYLQLQSQLNSARGNPGFIDINEVSPNWVASQGEVKRLLAQGRAQYLYGDYMGAMDTFGRAITYDPDNMEARAYALLINKLLLSRGYINREITRTQMIRDVENAWLRPDVYVGETDTTVAQVDNKTLTKLRTIVIPSIQFADAPLQGVVQTLIELSRQYDTAGEGVNMIVLNPPAGSEVPANPPVTIQLYNQTLQSILTAVCRQTNYSYEIEQNIVTLKPGSDQGSTGQFEARDFPLPQPVITRLTGLRLGAAASGGGGGGGDPFADPGAGAVDSGGGSDSQIEAAMRNFFSRVGVTWPPGSNIAYAAGSILVTNSPSNLERITNILRRFKDIKQVEIEARFLDVQQGALQELGFKWNISNTNNPNDFFRTGFTPTSPATTATYGVNSTLRLLDQTVSQGSAGASVGRIVVPGLPANPLTGFAGTTGLNEPQVTRIPILPGAINTGQGASSVFSGVLGVFDGYKVQMIINALEQTNGADLMSAPKVTVLSDKTAEIVVAQQLRYPTSFSQTESNVGTGGTLTAGGGAVSITPGTPEGFEVEQIGVVLQVTPTVEADDSINLQLEPRVTEFEGFIEYGGMAVAISGGGTVVTTPSGFIQPIFSVRQVRTEVTIFDGATLVIGGLTREEVKTVHDKVPILGDIPIIGRAFQSKGETSVKRNLMIFVTANLISANGSPLRQSFPSLAPGSMFQNATLVTPARAMSRAVRVAQPQDTTSATNGGTAAPTTGGTAQ